MGDFVMKKLVLLTLALGTLAVAGCRREVPYEPLKLGGPVETQQQQVR